MKKKDLLEILEKQCILSDICKVYYDKYSDVLNSFLEDEELTGIYRLEGEEFKSVDSFDRYLRENEKTPEKVETRLNSIYEDLVQMGKSRKNEAKKIVRKASLVRVGIVSGVLIAIALGVTVVAILGLVNVISKDLSDTLSSIFGMMDCVLGIIFFVYEIINDKIQESEIDSGNGEAIKSIVFNNSKVAYGPRSKVVDNSKTIINYSSKDDSHNN